MAHLKNKTIRELNEKDLRKESGKLKPCRKDIARMLTRINELKKK